MASQAVTLITDKQTGDAVQYAATAASYAECVAFLGFDDTYIAAHPSASATFVDPATIVHLANASYTLADTDWIVKLDDDTFEVLTNAEFEARYTIDE
jgi:hypothetical protein